jgi:hypothetical protein
MEYICSLINAGDFERAFLRLSQYRNQFGPDIEIYNRAYEYASRHVDSSRFVLNDLRYTMARDGILLDARTYKWLLKCSETSEDYLACVALCQQMEDVCGESLEIVRRMMTTCDSTCRTVLESIVGE